MDASELYPEGYHPRDIDRSRDYTRRAKHYTRTEKPPKYYLTCFGKATHYSEDGPVFDLPTWGFDKSVPEFCVVPPRPCNPFATDVYYLGNMLKEHFQVVSRPRSHLSWSKVDGWLALDEEGFQIPGRANREHDGRYPCSSADHGRSGQAI
jgi:hypothetical protein